MKKHLLKTIIAVAVISPFSQVTQAQSITFNGFASLVMGKTTSEPKPEEEQERLTNIYRTGYNDKLSFKEESIFAIQSNADLGEGLSATTLLYAEGKNNYNPRFFAAYLGYEVNDNLRINAGRIPWPLFQYTDYLDVGYAYPWVSPPSGIYDLSTTNNLDGVTAIYNQALGAWDSTFQVHTDANNIFGIKGSVSYDWLTFNLIYVHNRDTTVAAPPYQQVADALIDSGFTQQGDDLAMDEDSTDFLSAGFNIEYGDWLVIGEYASVDFDPGWFSGFEAYYLTVGHRFGDVLVHLTYDVQEETPQLDYLNGLGPDELGTMVDIFPGWTIPVAAVENMVRGRAQDYTNITAGARWDFHPSAAFKIDYTSNQTDDGDDVVGIKEFDQNLIRIALDLVF